MPKLSQEALRGNCLDIAKLEEARASTGVLPGAGPSPSSQVHKAIIEECDYRKGLAFGVLKQQEAPLSYVRSLIQSGDFAPAKELLEKLADDGEGDVVSTSLVSFEQTRIAFFEADWERTIVLGEKTEKLSPPAVTKLALSQLLANAFFESRLFEKCDRKLAEVEALGSLFPHALSLLYAQMLRIRLTARTLGPDSAMRKLDQIFKERVMVAGGQPNNDLVFSYLRAKMDAHRVKGQSALAEAVACYVLSEAVGDKLYAALAVLDVHCEFGQTPPEFVASALERCRRRFARVDRVAQEVEGARPATVTGSTLATRRQFAFVNGSHSFMKGQILERILQEETRSALISLKPHRMMIATSPHRAVSFVKENQVPQVLGALAGGDGVSKEDFFEALWGSQKFVAELHETNISSLLHRARKDYGVPVRMSRGRVRCEQIILEIS